MSHSQTEGRAADSLEQIGDLIAQATPVPRIAIEVITHFVKANRNELAGEVGNLMRTSGKARGADVIVPDTEMKGRMRKAVARREVTNGEFHAWHNLLCGLILAQDGTSALQL